MGNTDDVIVWPDGEWCYRDELHEYTHKSDDYDTYHYGTADWIAFLTIDAGLDVGSYQA